MPKNHDAGTVTVRYEVVEYLSASRICLKVHCTTVGSTGVFTPAYELVAYNGVSRHGADNNVGGASGKRCLGWDVVEEDVASD